MGQAKQRGTKEQRIAQAKERLAALRPETLVCGSCQTAFSEFEAMDTRGMRGIDAVFAGQCPSCGESVIAFKGEPDAVADAALAWQDAMGGDGKLGSQSSDGRYASLEDE
ncbi:hypothetical protein [Cupriavidus pinatubonensis]|uniref:Small CPxCG-related zinc finger protein n=1 Tax=Cupriavidus pinatubonensis TaxID=248026 RepID=A0ABM8WR53_9BURK|nr:hypothetical protein [Cupriavidus pinatubonensis]CAG9169931.1 hypothetical protein LMG23994_01735 [Cupriavidus pinatubonensis]